MADASESTSPTSEGHHIGGLFLHEDWLPAVDALRKSFSRLAGTVQCCPESGTHQQRAASIGRVHLGATVRRPVTGFSFHWSRSREEGRDKLHRAAGVCEPRKRTRVGATLCGGNHESGDHCLQILPFIL